MGLVPSATLILVILILTFIKIVVTSVMISCHLHWLSGRGSESDCATGYCEDPTRGCLSKATFVTVVVASL